MQVLRQLVVRVPSWSPDVQLHAAAVVCAYPKNGHRNTVRASLQKHPRALTDSQPSSLRLLPQVNTPFPQYQSRVSIHRVRPTSGFLLSRPIESDAARRLLLQPGPLFRRVARDWALTTRLELSLRIEATGPRCPKSGMANSQLGFITTTASAFSVLRTLPNLGERSMWTAIRPCSP